jgi:hypothetical protein
MTKAVLKSNKKKQQVSKRIIASMDSTLGWQNIFKKTHAGKNNQVLAVLY